MRPQSQFLHSCMWERFIYSQDGPHIWLQQNRQTILEICKFLIYECRNWETEHYNSILEIRMISFIFWEYINAASHLYWILTGPSFAVHLAARTLSTVCMHHFLAKHTFFYLRPFTKLCHVLTYQKTHLNFVNPCANSASGLLTVLRNVLCME